MVWFIINSTYCDKRNGCCMSLSPFEILQKNWSRHGTKNGHSLTWPILRNFHSPVSYLCSPSQRSLIRGKMCPSAIVLLVHFHGRVYYHGLQTVSNQRLGCLHAGDAEEPSSSIPWRCTCGDVMSLTNPIQLSPSGTDYLDKHILCLLV